MSLDLSRVRVEKFVPIPQKGERGRMLDFLRGLSVGDSFVVDRCDASKFNSTAYSIGIKTKSAKIGEGKKRIWIVEKAEGARSTTKGLSREVRRMVIGDTIRWTSPSENGIRVTAKRAGVSVEVYRLGYGLYAITRTG